MTAVIIQEDGSVIPCPLPEKAQALAGVTQRKSRLAPPLDFSRLVSSIPRTHSRSRKIENPKPNAESWSLIDELSRNRNSYKVPEVGGVPLKLCVPYQEQVSRLCQRVGLGHNGKDPGFQPACSAMIKNTLPVIEEWTEAKELGTSVNRRKALPDDVDKGISREICRYAKGLKLRAAPSDTTGTHNVVVDSELGSRLKVSANRMEIPYHNLASLCVLVALLVQPVGVNCEEKEEISALVREIRKQMHTAAWCAAALMDKLEAEQAEGSNTRVSASSGKG